jgi:hypothetical protein
MTILLNLITITMFALPQQSGTGEETVQSPTVSRQAGASLVLPNFDPAVSFNQLEKGMRRLDPVTETLREANETLHPLVEEFKIDPSLENQAKLESALANFTSDLARKIRGALAVHEKVTFAFQDIVHGVKGMGGSLKLYSADLQQQAEAEEAALSENVKQLEDAAEAWDLEDEPEEKAELMERFKGLYRTQQRIAYRARYMGALANHYKDLAGGVEQLDGSLRMVHGRVEDAYDRLEDAGEMLAFAAGFRRDATGIVAHYQSFFGQGNDSVRNVLERIQSIEGRLQIFEGASSVLDQAGPLMPMLHDMNQLTQGLRRSAETADTKEVVSEDSYWETKIQATLRGE